MMFHYLIQFWVMRIGPLPGLPLLYSLECNVPEKQGSPFVSITGNGYF